MVVSVCKVLHMRQNKFNMTKMKRQSRQPWALYCRSYLLTLGVLVSTGAGFAAYLHSVDAIVLPWWGMLIVCTFVMAGCSLICFSVFCKDAHMQRWAEQLSSHEASLAIMVISFPAYVILKPFYGRP